MAGDGEPPVRACDKALTRFDDVDTRIERLEFGAHIVGDTATPLFVVGGVECGLQAIAFGQNADEISLLVREVETAQRAFDAVGQRTTQSRLESQSIQTNVAVLNPASEPLKASKPKVLLNILLSIFVGTMLGVGAALTLELLHRRVRSPEDLSLALDLPVLAILEPEANTGTWLDRLGKLLPGRRLQTA